MARVQEATGTSGTVTAGAANSGATIYQVNVNTKAASAVATVYDGTSTSGTVVATIDASALGVYAFGPRGAFLKNGLYVTVTGGAAKVSVVFD